MGQEILVVVEHQKGAIADVTFELLGKGRELASATGGTLTAALFGSGHADAAASLGAADKVVYVDHERLADFNPEPYLAALCAAVESKSPKLVVIANTSIGMDLAASLSVKASRPLVAYCVGLAVEGTGVIATSQLYGGKILAESVIEGDGVVSVLAGSFPGDAGRADGAPSVESMDAPASIDEGQIAFEALIQPTGGDVDITQHDVLIAAGRGIGSEDKLPLVEELAAKLGGAVCASRPLVDSAWLPKDRQVGKSGLTVKPKIYLALGISGAPEHIEGMKDAELIIAINTDEGAPIFGHAHYGVTEDLFDIVPALIEKL